MASEARINSGLQIKVGELDYVSRPSAFTADVSAASAPTPGQVTALVTPTIVSLTARSVPGLARVQNLDATNYVEIGTYNSDDGDFQPMLEMLPGESYVVRMSRILGKEVVGTGTDASTVSLAMRANTASCICLVEVFEK